MQGSVDVTVVWTCILSLDDENVKRVVYFTVYNLVLFSNWGTPSLNTFINEMKVYQYLKCLSHTVTHLKIIDQCLGFAKNTRVSVKVTEGITTWYQSFG